MQSAKRVLSFRQLKPEKGIPWTRQYIRRLEKRSQFPHHIHVGPGTIGWLEHELDEWLDARVAESRAEQHRRVPPTHTPIDVVEDDEPTVLERSPRRRGRRRRTQRPRQLEEATAR